MKVIENIEQMHMESDALRKDGQTIALVPTMGFLHEGHLKLMRVAREQADKLIVSIFVNPAQFGPNEDYEQYPRDRDGDLSKVREEGVDIVFMPSGQGMYAEGFQTTVKVEKITRHLCGISRPGHFEGVATVVTKLFNCTKPHIAVFGEKDYQQLAVIRRMVKDLDMDIQIVGVPTVREADGLAMSSRNVHLSPEERISALCLKKSMDLAERMFQDGTADANLVKAAVETFINSQPFTQIDYVSICDPSTLEEVKTLGKETLLALAVRVGDTRLIDNCLIPY